MQTQASQHAVQRTTPASSGQTFWDAQKAVFWRVLLLPGSVESLCFLQFPSRTSSSPSIIASLSLLASAYHSPKFPCNLDLAGPLVAPFTCQLDSVWWISAHLSTSSAATNHFILLNFSWFTFWKEDTDRSGPSFQTRMAQVAGQPMNLLALAQIWGLEPALGRQMGTRG